MMRTLNTTQGAATIKEALTISLPEDVIVRRGRKRILKNLEGSQEFSLSKTEETHPKLIMSLKHKILITSSITSSL